METLIKADIFFFISSIATVVLTILISVLLCYLIKAGKNLHAISGALKNDFEQSEEYVEELWERLENNMLFRILFSSPRKHKKQKRKNKIEPKFDTVNNPTLKGGACGMCKDFASLSLAGVV